MSGDGSWWALVGGAGGLVLGSLLESIRELARHRRDRSAHWDDRLADCYLEGIALFDEAGSAARRFREAHQDPPGIGEDVDTVRAELHHVAAKLQPVHRELELLQYDLVAFYVKHVRDTVIALALMPAAGEDIDRTVTRLINVSDRAKDGMRATLGRPRMKPSWLFPLRQWLRWTFRVRGGTG